MFRIKAFRSHPDLKGNKVLRENQDHRANRARLDQQGRMERFLLRTLPRNK